MKRVAILLFSTLLATSAIADDPYTRAQAGFAAYERGDYETAVTEFEAALAAKPDLPLAWAQLGYAYRKLSRNGAAAHAFRQALRTGITDNRYGYRREVQTLENRFDASAYLIYRQAALSDGLLAAAGPSLAQSQGGVELAWTPPRFGFRDGRRLQIFGRLAWGHSDDFALKEDSAQAGVGVRYKPWRDQNLVFSAERLAALGREARNDWMLRASYSWDMGFDLRPEEKSWTYATLYLDAAMIDVTDPDVLLAGEGRYGRSFLIGGGAYGPAVLATPHLVIAGNVQKDAFHTTTLVEAGPGLSAKLFFADTPEAAHGGTLELLVQYRVKIGGDSVGGSGVVATLVVQY
ncbi:MAG: tetratricopeptide repeat protein [Sphingomonadales bacterium]|nr:tetratricopeptide repeat protein [Sphingomonadales bacterium]